MYDVSVPRDEGCVKLWATNRKQLGLPESVKPDESFFENQKSQHCMKNAFNNLYGYEAISFQDLNESRIKMDEDEWRPWREDILRAEGGTSAKAKDKLDRSLRNGSCRGEWTVSVLDKFLNDKTDVRLRRLTRRKAYGLSVEEVEALSREAAGGCLLLMLQWYQHRQNQGHCIAVRNLTVYDGFAKTPMPLHEYSFFMFVSRVYSVELNVNVMKKISS